MIRRYIGKITGHSREQVSRLIRDYKQTGRLKCLEAIYPKPNLSRRNTKHKIYPHLLRNVAVTRPNQVWALDITYIRTEGGSDSSAGLVQPPGALLAAVKDTGQLVLRGGVASLRLCRPIFNTDQSSQYRSEAFTGMLLDHKVKISMDGKGRALDNVFVERLWRSAKDEDVYLKGYATMKEVKAGLKSISASTTKNGFTNGLTTGRRTRYTLFREQRNALLDLSKNDRSLVCQTGPTSHCWSKMKT